MPAPTAATAKAGAAAGRLVAGAAASSPAPSRVAPATSRLCTRSAGARAGQHHAERGEDAECERQSSRRGHAQPEAALGVEHEEGGQRGVAEDPQGLSRRAPRARPGRRASSRNPTARSPRASTLAAARPRRSRRRDQGRGHGCHCDHAGRQRERGRGRGLDQRAADRDRHHRADEACDLLRARGGRAAAVLNVVRDDRPVRGGERVEPGVDERRRRGRGRCRSVPFPSPTATRPPAVSTAPPAINGKPTPAAIRPDPDRDRNAEACDRVDHHHHADQRRASSIRSSRTGR